MAKWYKDDALSIRKDLIKASGYDLNLIKNKAIELHNSHNPNKLLFLIAYAERLNDGCKNIVMSGNRPLFQNFSYLDLDSNKKCEVVAKLGGGEADMEECLEQLFGRLTYNSLKVSGLAAGTPAMVLEPLMTVLGNNTTLQMIEPTLQAVLPRAIRTASKAFELKKIAGSHVQLILESVQSDPYPTVDPSEHTAIASIHGGFSSTTHELAHKRHGVPLFSLVFKDTEAVNKMMELAGDEDFLSRIVEVHKEILSKHGIEGDSLMNNEEAKDLSQKYMKKIKSRFIKISERSQISRICAMLTAQVLLKTACFHIMIIKDYLNIMQVLQPLMICLRNKHPLLGHVDIIAFCSTEESLAIASKVVNIIVMPEFSVTKVRELPIEIVYSTSGQFMSNANTVYRCISSDNEGFDVVANLDDALHVGEPITLFKMDGSSKVYNLSSYFCITHSYDIKKPEVFEEETLEMIRSNNQLWDGRVNQVLFTQRGGPHRFTSAT